MPNSQPPLPFVIRKKAPAITFYSNKLKDSEDLVFDSANKKSVEAAACSSPSVRTRAKKLVVLDSDEENRIQIVSTPSTRIKNKSRSKISTKRREPCPIIESDSDLESIEKPDQGSSPPKFRKIGDDKNEKQINLSPKSSTLLDLLNIDDESEKYAHKETASECLYSVQGKYQNARQALHSAAPANLPGREKELSELECFLRNHLRDETSGSLYVSGPPGTGKTASLSKVLEMPEFKQNFEEVYVNCTGIKSSGTIYSRVCQELCIKVQGRTEKNYLSAIEKHLSKSHKMILMVLDEIDQLDSRKQSVLYSIFEWPSRPSSKIVLIGIANALDLTDRILPRLQARCVLKPKLMHFAPYSKQQIVEIFTERLKEANVSEVFSPVALQMLAGKVSAVSGDVRRALDIGRRVVEIAEEQRRNIDESVKENEDNVTVKEVEETKLQSVELKEVLNVLNNVYGTAQNLDDSIEECFPLQQKILLCTLILMLKKGKNKDITIGRLHDVYKRVCSKRNILAVDQTEFVGLCSLVDSRGIVRVTGKKEPRLHKVSLQWDEEEVGAALKDKQLMASILEDSSCLGMSGR